MQKKRERFAIVPGWIFDCAEVTATETLVFACLCLFTNEKKTCFPSVAELARVSKLGKSTVARDLARLEGKGALWRKNRYNAGGQTSNFYELSETLPYRATETTETLPRRGGCPHHVESGALPRGGKQHHVTIPNKQGDDRSTLSLIEREKSLERVAPLRDFEEAAKAMIIELNEEEDKSWSIKELTNPSLQWDIFPKFTP